jgi:hypothetical protein
VEAVHGGFRGEGAFAWALTEGGPRNGVRTAVEDFVAHRPALRFHLVSPIFGLGVVTDRRAPWASRVVELLAPWVHNALLTRMERNRLDLYLHVIRLQDEMTEAARRRQREWARLDTTLAEQAARELELLDLLARTEHALEAERDTSRQARAALEAKRPRPWSWARGSGALREWRRTVFGDAGSPADESTVAHVAQVARAAGGALRARGGDPRLRAAVSLVRAGRLPAGTYQHHGGHGGEKNG